MGEQRNRLRRPWRPPQQSAHRPCVFFFLPSFGQGAFLTLPRAKPEDTAAERRSISVIVNKAPGILHRLNQSAFVVTRRWSGLFVLDFRIVQLRGLAVAQRRQQLRLVALFVGGLPVG